MVKAEERSCGNGLTLVPDMRIACSLNCGLHFGFARLAIELAVDKSSCGLAKAGWPEPRGRTLCLR